MEHNVEGPEVLIVGAGVAGLTAAWWLKRYGFRPTLVERFPQIREGGYLIDFWGSGFDVAEKMGMLQTLEKKHHPIAEMTFVDRHGKRKGGFSVGKIRSLVSYRHFSLLRGSLVHALYEMAKTEDLIEFIFSDSVKEIRPGNNRVTISFDHRDQREFDLVIGADGLHSVVRSLVFGPESEYEMYLGYYVATFIVDADEKDRSQFAGYSMPGKQVAVYGLPDRKMAAFFIFRREDPLNADYHDSTVAKEILWNVFHEEGWRCREILQKMESAADFYFDSVSQIRITPWSKGRIVLLGDACQCVSLIAGQGAALAMAGAYILAGELKRGICEIESAFNTYENMLRPEIRTKQKLAEQFAASFVPDSKLGIWVRNKFTNLMFLPLVSKWFVRQFLLDSLQLPEY